MTAAVPTRLDRTTSIDTTVSSDAPATVTLTESDADHTDVVSPTPEPGDDGATTPGGPTMVLIITGVLVLISWLRRHRRRRRKTALI
ncbi:MAG: hypothetical protein WBB07_23275 [Mycobacterium sp.]